jgi:predicted XRE-type DNA-binding protein
MKNIEIKDALKEANMKQWQLAELLGITEWTLSRKLRKELPEADKKEILAVIQKG